MLQARNSAGLLRASLTQTTHQMKIFCCGVATVRLFDGPEAQEWLARFRSRASRGSGR
jgi:hypothetical protein